jgi:hypothetical protein
MIVVCTAPVSLVVCDDLHSSILKDSDTRIRGSEIDSNHRPHGRVLEVNSTIRWTVG